MKCEVLPRDFITALLGAAVNMARLRGDAGIEVVERIGRDGEPTMNHYSVDASRLSQLDALGMGLIKHNYESVRAARSRRDEASVVRDFREFYGTPMEYRYESTSVENATLTVPVLRVLGFGIDRYERNSSWTVDWPGGLGQAFCEGFRRDILNLLPGPIELQHDFAKQIMRWSVTGDDYAKRFWKME